MTTKTIKKVFSATDTNLLFVENRPELATTIHPSYLSYKHVNPILKAMSAELAQEEIYKVIHGFRRSDYSEDALIEDYKRGDINYHKIQKDEHYLRALEKTKQLFKPQEKYRPVSFPDLRYYPWKLPTSAEAPYSNSEYWKQYVKRKFEQGKIPNERITFHNLYNEIFIHNREKVHRIKDGIYTDRHGDDLRYYNQAHARSHLVKTEDPDKIRMVFGVPKLLLMIECMFFWPLVNSLLNKDGPMLWGFETLKGGWYAIYNWMSADRPICSTYLALDWKQFDKRAYFDIIDDIYEILESFIEFERGYIPTTFYPDSYTDPMRLKRLWNWMKFAIMHTPDVLPNGDVYIRQFAGIASGYFQTQLLDSMYNCTMLLTILSRLGFNIDKIKLKVQGDDSLIGILEFIPPGLHQSTLDTIAHYAKVYFGAVLNTKKSRISNTLEGLPVLGFTNHFGTPTRDMYELLANLTFPEKKSDENRLMARCIGIAYANCGYHPQVYRICENVFNYLKEKGFSPNAAGLPAMLIFLTDSGFFIKIDENSKFPTYYETICQMINVPKREDWQVERNWPSCIFLTRY